MKNSISIFLLISVFSILTENIVNSQVADNVECDITKADQLSSLAQQYEENLEYDSAVFFYKKAGICFEKNEAWLNCVKNYKLTAKNYLMLAKYDSADTYLKKALEIANNHFSMSNKNEVSEKADVLLVMADYQKFIGNFEEKLNICKKAQKLAPQADSLVIGNIWDKIGETYTELFIADSAYLYCSKALTLKKRIIPYDNPEVAESYNTMGLFYRITGNYDSALTSFQKALDINLRFLKKESPEIASGYSHIGMAYSYKGDYETALKYYQKALKIRIKIFGEKHPYVASCLDNIGVVYDDKGENDKALEYYQKALGIYIETFGEQHQKIASCYNNIGLAYNAKGKYDKALEYYQKALKINIENLGEMHQNVADYYNNIGIIYFNKGDYEKSLEYIQKALKIDIKIFGEQHLNAAYSFNNIGVIYQKKGEYDKALEHYQKALKIRIKILGEKHSYVASCLVNIGSTYSCKGLYDKALEYFQKVLKIDIETFGEKHSNVASSLNNIGTVYNDKGEYVKALEYFQKALKIHIDALGEQHPDVSNDFNNIGEANKLQGKYSEAIKNYQKALMANLPDFNDTSIYSNPKLQNVLSNPILLNSLTGKADALFMLYKYKTNAYTDLKASLSTYELAFQLINIMRNEYNIENTKLLLSENTKNYYAKAVQAAKEFNQLNNDSEKNDFSALSFIEKGKSSTITAIFNESQAKYLAGIPDSLITNEKELRNNILQLETEIDKEKFYNQEIDSMTLSFLEDQKFIYSRKLDSLISYFEVSYPAYYKLKYSNQTVSIPEIQNNIDNLTAMLNYLVGDTTLFIAVVTDSIYHIETIPIDPSFRELVTSFYQDLKSAEKESFQTNSNLIYKKVIQPIKKYTTGKEKLLIIPDDYLYYLPFETLIENTISSNSDNFSDYNYLVKNHTIQYHQSATLWYNSQIKEQQHFTNIDNLICFAPVFTKKANNSSILSSNIQIIDTTDNPYSSRSVSRDGKNFNPLPYSKNEVESIVKLFEEHNKEAIAYLYNDANELNFKTKTSTYKYIHISSHSFSNDNTPSLSGIVFSQNNSSDSIKGEREDGILFTGETYDLDLNSDLIVLSSCESGMGKLVRGEGLITLSRGFMYTGTPNIVYSLWKVPDKSTNHLMYSFYKYVLEGKSYAQALRYAKLDMMKNEKYAFPLFWSGFVIIGR